ncbi:unnamed protein product, partial [Brassica oleracea]
MSDLPDDLAEEILSRVPLTSLSAVRSTCRKWNDLSKNQVFGKSASTGRKQFLGFMLKDYKVCSMKFDLQGIGNEGDFVDPSIKEVSILDQVEITQVFHCGGLLLCVTKDRSRLLVWNPYLGQTRWIQPRNTFRSEDRYAVGYDKNRNYKILRVFGKYDTKGEFGSVDKYLIFGYEIYELSSSSWKVFNVSPDWNIDSYQHGVSLKGHTYFLAEERWTIGRRNKTEEIISFDFTTEKFGKRLPLPFKTHDVGNFVSLSCVREEQLAVLHQSSVIDHTLEIWVSSNIDLGAVSWSKFLRTTSFCRVDFQAGSFFIDEEKKVAVVVDLDNGGQARTETHYNQRANIIGEDEYFKPVNVGEALDHGKLNKFGFLISDLCRPVVCSYVPSTAQLQMQPDNRNLREKRESSRIKRNNKIDEIISFDFTTERFGEHLPLPIKNLGKFVSLSCVREEQLALLHQSSVIDHTLEIWVSSKIDLGAVSWSKFLRTTSFCRVDFLAGSFFIDEEKKVAVVVDLDNGGQARTETRYNQRANIIGQDEYFKPVNVGKALDHGKLNKFGFLISDLCRPLVCSYVPSSVQL